MFNKWKTKFFRTKKTSKGKKSKKEGQQDFFEDVDEAKKQSSSKFGFAEGTAFSKKKKKEEKKAKKETEDRITKAQAEIDAAILEKEAKQRFRAGADVQVLNPSEKGKYPQEIAVKVRKPQDIKYIKIDLIKSEVTVTKDTPTGVSKGDNIRIVSESGQKPKIDDIKLLGAKVRINDSGQVFYDKVPLKGKKSGFVKASFKGFSESGKGIKGYAAKLKRKAGKGLNIEF